MASQRSFITWTRDEVVRLVGWMEEHQELLRGKQSAWFKDIKDQEFADEEHITVKKITDKVQNMKKAWRVAKAMQERSGWGLTMEENSTSINHALEKKCAFFWRLEEIWGTRPNVAIPATIQSTSTTEARQSPDGPPTPSQSQPSLSQPAPAPPAAIASSIDPRLLDDHDDDDDSSDWQLSPPAASSPAPSPPKSTPKPSSERSTPSRSMSGSGSASRGKRDWGTMLKQALEDRTSVKSDTELKRHRAELEIKKEEIEIKKERIASQERMAASQERMAASQERIVKLQAEAQIKQAESFARVMERMVDILGGSAGGVMPRGTADPGVNHD